MSASLRSVRCFCPRARCRPSPSFFFINDPPPTEIYTLSLHDALPISVDEELSGEQVPPAPLHLNVNVRGRPARIRQDRKSTRLNSSHRCISYAVFCLKKKNNGESRCNRGRQTMA